MTMVADESGEEDDQQRSMIEVSPATVASTGRRHSCRRSSSHLRQLAGLLADLHHAGDHRREHLVIYFDSSVFIYVLILCFILFFL